MAYSAQEKSADVQTINGFDDAVFEAALECAVKFVTQPEASGDLLEVVSGLADTHGVQRPVLRNAVRTIVLTMTGGVTKQMSPPQVQAELLGLGLVQGKADQIVEAFTKNAATVASSIADQTITVNELVDMQWKFGVTAANAELSQVGSTLLQMKFVVDKGGQLENIFSELSLPQFYAFLSEMEQANVALNDLS